MLIQILPQRMFSGMNSYAMIALPLFILMGQVMNASTITKRLIDFCMIFVGKLRGGLLFVDVVASMIFGGISGSSTSDVASLGSILIPEQQRRGYPAHFAAGITVASSTMGMIIPPSVAMVIYAIASQQSVGRLFLGGAIPGILIGVSQLLIVFIMARHHHYPREEVDTSLRGIARELRQSILILAMPVFIVGSVTFGIATATESAAMKILRPISTPAAPCWIARYATRQGSASYRTLHSSTEHQRAALRASASMARSFWPRRFWSAIRIDAFYVASACAYVRSIRASGRLTL